MNFQFNCIVSSFMKISAAWKMTNAEILKLLINLYFEYKLISKLSWLTDLDWKHFVTAQENNLICAFCAEFNAALTVALWFVPT